MHDDVMDALPHDFMLNLRNSIKLANRYKELEKMSQEEQPQGLCVELSQDHDRSNVVLYEDIRFVQGLGVWAPVIVQTQKEKDYLDSLGLMLGKDTKNMVLVDGIDENTMDTPPTWARIPHLLD